MVLLSSVIAAGLLISGAVTISGGGRETPADADTGLFEQLIGGAPGVQDPRYPADPLPGELGPGSQRLGGTYPSPPAGDARTAPDRGSADGGAVPPPTGTPGGATGGTPAGNGAGTAVANGGAGAGAGRPATGGTGTGSTDRGTGSTAGGAPAGSPAGNPAPAGSTAAGQSGATGGSEPAGGSAPAPAPAPAPAQKNDDGAVGGLVNGLTDTVGGLLGG